MESEKIENIKKDIEICTSRIECKDCSLVPIMTSTNCRNELLKNCLTLINELESENERLGKELNEEFAKRVNAEREIEHQQHYYKIGLTHSQTANKKLKKRIAELEKENANKTDTITGLLEKQDFYETERLKQFAERLKNKFEHCVGDIYHADTIDERIDETLKEVLGEE